MRLRFASLTPYAKEKHMTETNLIILGIGYLLGSIPFGLIFSWYGTGQDIRTIGSGNIGATNVLRTGNKKLALLTLACDAGKAILPVLVAQLFSTDTLAPSLMLAGVAVGHIFPIWLKFKGGKGVATLAGGTLILFPFIGAIALGIWVLVFFISRISSLSALAAIGASIILVFLLPPCPIAYGDHNCLISVGLFITTCLLVIFRHHENIKRLLIGQERSFRQDS